MESPFSFYLNKLIHSGLSIKESMDGSHQITLDYVRSFYLKAKLWYVAPKDKTATVVDFYCSFFVSFDFFWMFSHSNFYIIGMLISRFWSKFQSLDPIIRSYADNLSPSSLAHLERVNLP